MSLDAIARIRNAPPTKPFVVAQLGQSLDGRIATPTGESRWINKQAALVHIHRVRAAVDAIVVGIGTVIADDPLLNVRHVEGPNPVRVVIDPSGRVSSDAKCFAADGTRRVVITAEGIKPNVPSGVEVLALPRGPHGLLSPTAIVAALGRIGLRTMLIEGGATTVSSFIDADAVDRLHVLVAPVILGSGKTGLSLLPIERLSEAKRPSAEVHVLEDGDVLFDCDMRSRREA